MNFNQKFKSALTKAFNKEVSQGYDPSDAFKSSAEAKNMIKNGEEDEMEVEGEMEEATGSGSAGGYSAPLFGTIKKENVTEMTTTSSSGAYIYSNQKRKKSDDKVKTNEATTASEVGRYGGPAFLAKNKKNWRGKAKPAYPKGKFVQVKEECKTFPYCIEGGLEHINVTENRNLSEAKKGGLSKGMTLKDIAKKHNPKYDQKYYQELQQELKKGISVEKEHTSSSEEAKKIAMDHLVENPKYYTKLKKFEKDQGEKVEAKEATTSASSGAYSGPAFLAKNKKNWRGGAKPIYSGGQFVQVKKRCKTFPYCNQGDINALKLTENRLLAEAVENISKKTGLSQEMILNMILKEIGK
jgi:hypothetical protein